ncbi:hypothetical protein ACGFY3_21090 [Streptomyces mirabilis]|uniref:hypothetical protein n=1 Tax=Streptomyces mirabilis TaxID=68239 RepID=UPI0037244581
MWPIPPNILRKYPTLFEGTVTSVKGTSVFFHVDRWLRGGDADTVRLQNGDPSSPETLTFQVGDHYTVASTKDGTVPSLCLVFPTQSSGSGQALGK